MKRLSRLLLLSLLPIGAEIFLHSKLARAQNPCCDPSACDGYCGQNDDCSCIEPPSDCDCGLDDTGCECAPCGITDPGDGGGGGGCGCGCGCGCTEDGCY